MPNTHYFSFKETLVLLILVCFLPFGLMMFSVLKDTEGAFTYTLDDPYIHLALAKNILLGNYGINLSELSAPSSSIFWPFLLAPFSISKEFFEFVPLIINASCLCLLALVINRMFSDLKFSIRLLITAVLLLSLNAYGLVFTGMEHSLQLLVVALILLPILGKTGLIANQQAMPNYVFWALILLPLVRYEGLAISLPVLLYIFTKNEKQKAVFALLMLVSILASFSLYLYQHGLGFLPSSVLAKTSYTGLSAVKENLSTNLYKYGFIFLPVVLCAIHFWHKDRALSMVILSTTSLHFLLGKHGWFGRYENYYLLFVVLICLRSVISLNSKLLSAILCLPFMFFSLVMATRYTPLAASNIYNQQVQMAKIASILAEPVAVNDLGLVALRSGQYVLDLSGLGSIEALHYRKSSTNSEWMHKLMEIKHVNYAIIYESILNKQKPESWIKVGELKLLQTLMTPFGDTVAFYATDSSHAEKLSTVLKEFSQQNRSTQFSIRII